MGFFSKNRSYGARPSVSRTRSSTFTHHAKWGANGATFFVNPEGVSWSYDSAPSFMDDPEVEAALSQLERAYHLHVSFPDAEESIMSMLRSMSPNITEGMVPHYSWRPPLPGS